MRKVTYAVSTLLNCYDWCTLLIYHDSGFLQIFFDPANQNAFDFSGIYGIVLIKIT